ncbi:MAG: hypothetical protein QXW70_03370 [Candidatus Anstonellales archaeon]
MIPILTFITLPLIGKKKKDEYTASKPNETGEPIISSCREGIYKKIIERYAEIIEESEAKSISELKGLVNTEDGKIKEIVSEIKKKYDDYNYERDFTNAAYEAVLFVSKIRTVSLPVNFWLSFSEIVEIGEADQMDKGILLCAILRALGSPNAAVFLSEAKNVYVLWNVDDVFYLFDAESNGLDTGREEEIKAKMGSSLLYSFNDKEYRDFSHVSISD